jgi:uncharacterized protein (UPF0332 family)
MSQDLLKLAEELAGQSEVFKKRKAVSTAYYAAFHEFCAMIADALVEDQTSPIYTKLYRYINHNDFNSDKLFNISDKISPELEAIRTTMRDLKEKREEADYFPASYQCDPTDSIAASRNVIALIRDIDEIQRRNLALNILVNGKNANRQNVSTKKPKSGKA